MKKVFFAVGAILIIGAFIWFLLNQDNKPIATDNGKISVVATIFPVYDMAKNIAGENADVFLMLPPGVEPHSFEPSPSDVANILKSDIFVYTGAEMEPWAADILAGQSENIVELDLSRGVSLIDPQFIEEDEPMTYDPHIWLDIDNAILMARTITDSLKQSDPQNFDAYESRFKNYESELQKIDAEYNTALATCQSRNLFYGGHYALGYLMKRYNLNYVAAQGVSPDAEPSARDLADLVDQIEKENIKTVFYEELSSPRIAQTIADETDAQMLLLNAGHNLEKEDFATGISFFDILRSNLENLKIGLGCK